MNLLSLFGGNLAVRLQINPMFLHRHVCNFADIGTVRWPINQLPFVQILAFLMRSRAHGVCVDGYNEFAVGEPIEILKMLFMPFVKRLAIERFYSPLRICVVSDQLEDFELTDLVGQCDVAIQGGALKRIEFNRVTINTIRWVSGIDHNTRKLNNLYWSGVIVLAEFDNLANFFEECQHAKFIALQWNHRGQVSWTSLAALFSTFQHASFHRLETLCVPTPSVATEDVIDWLQVFDELPALRELHLDIWMDHPFEYRDFVAKMQEMPNITVYLSGNFTICNLFFISEAIY